MKKLILIAIVIGSVYFIKPNLFSTLFTSGAFDSDGNPIVWLFTSENCGTHCEEVINLLDKRNVDYDEYDVNSDEGKDRLSEVGNHRKVPVIAVGSRSIVGSNKPRIISLLAEGLGEQALTPIERQVMQNHFYEGGEAMIVMYGTSWCGYCKKMRVYFDENNLDYTEFDAEGSGRQAYNVLTATGYPLMYVGFRRIDGANVKQLEKAIVDFDI